MARLILFQRSPSLKMLALVIILHLSQVAALFYRCDPHFSIVDGMACKHYISLVALFHEKP
ncbi:hypothetical protein PGT21_034439 [Puccinia graminis f. sp. tritici]|uniref:Uncharacterized protein n=1 Tax=Puccinia graminis f. sp. tritici TaxID=56615 RepID=A0A5B0LSR9_PUCGR|nr:hypothetical protein PGT21_034439 [Puccinia graminis f. sp. tritici]KAA1081782.1 hypothetical protein PGTUg99_006811 [Puccinia graminis f. sp. tritici]